MTEEKNITVPKNSQEQCCHPDQSQTVKTDFDFDSLYKTLKKVDTDLFFDLLSENYSAG